MINETEQQGIRQLTVRTNGEVYVFRYAAGQEEEVISEIGNCAKDSTNPFGWEDAAMATYEIGKRFLEESNRRGMRR